MTTERTAKVKTTTTATAPHGVALMIILGACTSLAKEPSPTASTEQSRLPSLPGPGAPSRESDRTEVSAPVRDWIEELERAFESRDRSGLAKRYEPNAQVLSWGDEPVSAQTHLESMLDQFMTPEKRFVFRAITSGKRAVVEWGGRGEHPAGLWGVLGASVLELDEEGLVTRETLYFDGATQLGQVGGGYRHCVPYRKPPAAPSTPPQVVGATTPSATATTLSRWILGPAAEGAKPVLVSNQLLAEDAMALFGTAPELAQGLGTAPDKTTVSECFGSDALAVCAVERRASFVAPVLGIRPSRKEGSLHFLVVGEFEHGELRRVIEYGGAELRSLLDLDGDGFLKPADAPSCASKASAGGTSASKAPVQSDEAVGTDMTVAAVVKRMAPGFRSCYNRGLSGDPNMAGSVRITTKVGPDGKVRSASPSEGGGLSAAVKSCLADHGLNARFPPPDGGGATLVIPVSFSSL
jgi:hypothetical protein